jgi:3-oxoacyl-(acyl-carrier-protein) synthase
MGNKKRVVITGMATINPIGDNLEDYYNNMMAGKSGVKKWHTIDVSKVECKIGGDMGDYDFGAALERLKSRLTEEHYKKIRKLYRLMTFSNKSAVITALEAYLDAGLVGYKIDPYRVSAMVGGHNFNTKYVMEQIHQFDEEPEYIDPLYGIEALDPNIPGTICEVLGIKGPAYNLGAACASGNIALRDGFRDIVTGECDVSVISGPMWDMNESDVHAMGYLNALVVDPQWLDCPEKASRPFDIQRSGFIASHGAATVVIEDLEHAKARGAKIYAEVLGVAANSNANHLPQPSSEAQANLMRNLLKMGDVRPEDVDYISCHATGTPLGDITELTAIKMAFGDHAYKMKFNAPKSLMGHTCWAAPIVELVGAVLQMNHGKLHQTINIDELAPEIDLDVCKDGPVDYPFNVFLKNSFGFGGLNCCSLIKKYEG